MYALPVFRKPRRKITTQGLVVLLALILLGALRTVLSLWTAALFTLIMAACLIWQQWPRDNHTGARSKPAGR